MVDTEVKSQSTLMEFAGETDTDIDRYSEQAKNVIVEVNKEYSNSCDMMENK